ncbi:YcdB/YcdC domain-containing protein [Brevibacillus choshinensis]|uniref:YcdB/YcdC repeated domain-containing protein n=1 Tax=Brevibacillus choshinensis TaxID=54911 RepID=A0ABX7FLN3_BRECH|nr:YcdB/YcdC domain-containing protein [Brevibacillus choshinensis]QRG66750.1 hypothetical protein JNE38_25115 [Brevibacillus choshinensis]
MKLVIRALIFFVLGCSLLPCTQMAYAEQIIAQKKTKKIPQHVHDGLARVISASPELAGLSLESTYLLEGDGHVGPERWEFSFVDSKDEDGWGAYADVEVDAKSGRLFQFDLNELLPEPTRPPSDDTAKKAAQLFLANVWGEYANHYRLRDVEVVTSESDVEVEHPIKSIVSYEFFIHDIPVDDFGIQVTVDGNGRVIELRNDALLSPEPSQFPDPDRALSHSQATKIYENLLGMSLAYAWEWEEDHQDGHPTLIYDARFREGAIDAFTGDLTNEVDSWIDQKPQLFSIQPQGIQLVAKSRKEAEKLLTKEFGVSFKGLRFIRDSSENDDDDDEEELYTSYSWGSPSKSKKPVFVTLTTERKTGRVVEYKYNAGNAWPKQRISIRKAQEKALNILTRYVDKNKDELSLSYSFSPFSKEDYPDWIDPHPPHQFPDFMNYSFRFHDRYEGIEVGYSSYFVEINPETGELSSLEMDQESLTDLPKPDGVIPAAKAAESYARANPLKLVYQWPRYYDQVRPSPILVYVPKYYESSWVNPFTGAYEKEEDE